MTTPKVRKAPVKKSKPHITVGSLGETPAIPLVVASVLMAQHPVISAPPLPVETDGTVLYGRWTIEIKGTGRDAEDQPVLMNKVESTTDGEIWRRCSWAFSELTGFGIAQNARGAFKIISVDHKSRLVTVERRAGYEVSPIGQAFMDRIRGRQIQPLAVADLEWATGRSGYYDRYRHW